MNDVFEHVSFPVEVLTTLRSKLKEGGRIFIDTPCHFWLYPVTKILSKKIHTKLLNGTVDFDHQQIWSQASFEVAVKKAGLKVQKITRLSEYTQGADFYLNNMKIEKGVVRLAGKIFFWLAPYIAKNKIMAVVSINN
jgi:2-polyprenyl-3-methyl-5-hydroxy-6-metoxy-1,4-benzoquinol methylase